TTPCNDVPVLRRAAMDYLARREHSLFELMQKLSKKFPETDKGLLLEVLETLKSEKLQSDERFTEAYVRYRKSRGFAYLHIKADLAGRRVSDSLITKHLLVDDEDWQRTAQQLVVKKLRHQESPSYGSKLHRKLTRFLESRGFASTEIRKALEKHLV
ncbi:MAG: regulatory protein, partial [Pseudohongiellaceae bacterium]